MSKILRSLDKIGHTVFIWPWLIGVTAVFILVIIVAGSIGWFGRGVVGGNRASLPTPYSASTPEQPAAASQRPTLRSLQALSMDAYLVACTHSAPVNIVHEEVELPPGGNHVFNIAMAKYFRWAFAGDGNGLVWRFDGEGQWQKASVPLGDRSQFSTLEVWNLSTRTLWTAVCGFRFGYLSN